MTYLHWKCIQTNKKWFFHTSALFLPCQILKTATELRSHLHIAGMGREIPSRNFELIASLVLSCLEPRFKTTWKSLASKNLLLSWFVLNVFGLSWCLVLSCLVSKKIQYFVTVSSCLKIFLYQPIPGILSILLNQWAAYIFNQHFVKFHTVQSFHYSIENFSSIIKA